MEFGVEKSAMLLMKNGKRKIPEGIELSNQERIRTFRESEDYMYLGIFEADTIKQIKLEKSTTGVRENFSKPKSSAAISSKG